jgi:ribosomal protein S18 acetylase RimI-like enzyme
VLDLVLARRLETGVKVHPTIWRVRLLLSSRVADHRRDVRVWEAETGELDGFAMLWRRDRLDPYLVLDHFIRTHVVVEGLFPDILDWGTRRASEIAAGERRALTLFADKPAGGARFDFVGRGFTPLAVDAQQRNAYFARDLGEPIPHPALPGGFVIRTLTRVDDLRDYEAMYGFAAVHPDHRRVEIESDEYAHIVADHPSGMPAAYCECSISRAEWERGAERIGWIDYVGTLPARQRKGLGHAVMLAALDRLRRWGSHQAMLVTRSDNVPAVALYRRVGFEPVEVDEPKRYQLHIPLAKRDQP